MFISLLNTNDSDFPTIILEFDSIYDLILSGKQFYFCYSRVKNI